MTGQLTEQKIGQNKESRKQKEEDKTANRLKVDGHDNLRYNYRYAGVI
jgi:hypothetical protein